MLKCKLKKELAIKEVEINESNSNKNESNGVMYLKLNNNINNNNDKYSMTSKNYLYGDSTIRKLNNPKKYVI